MDRMIPQPILVTLSLCVYIHRAGHVEHHHVLATVDDVYHQECGMACSASTLLVVDMLLCCVVMVP